MSANFVDGFFHLCVYAVCSSSDVHIPKANIGIVHLQARTGNFRLHWYDSVTSAQLRE